MARRSSPNFNPPFLAAHPAVATAVTAILKILAIGLFASLTACKSTPKDPAAKAAAQPGVSWPGQMQGLAQDIKKLLPYLYDRERFEDPKNRAEVAGYLKEFAQIAHHLEPESGKKFIGDDLLVEYSITHLKDDLTRAQQSFAAGQFEYSRSVAKSSLGHCFQCHSVTQPGSSAAWNLDQIHDLKLAPLEKADLLVATRKYDQALNFMELKLNGGELSAGDAFQFEGMLRRYLALTIRVENAPGRARSELDRLFAKNMIPPFLKEAAEGWRQSLREWVGEKKSSPKNSAEVFQLVEARFAKADKLKHFEKDHAGDVEYLRATAVLHDDMSLLKTAADEARALYLLGRAYEVLDELGSWNLHESYFEACVNKDPRLPVAKQCYARLEASLFMGYSGSAGTNLPPEEKERLNLLKAKLSAD